MGRTRCLCCRSPLIAGQCPNLGCFERAPIAEVIGPATSADLLDLDAVPEPTDSDSPAAVHQPRACCPTHGTPGFCNAIAWAAPGVLGEREFPTREAVEQALRDQHIDLSEVRLETAKCGWFPDDAPSDIHARTLARART
jgi:hypothetical protein